MNKQNVAGIHWSFWVISSLALLWNVMGVINFFVQMNPELLSVYRESERAIIATRPAWATVAFAFAVFGGSLGSLLLLLKMPSAYYFFIASLLGVIVTLVQTLGVGITFSAGEIVGIILLPLVNAGFLTWYTRRVERKGWLSKKQQVSG